MGRDKAWLEIEGKPLVVWQADRLAGVFDDVRVSAKDARPFAAAGLRVIEDGTADFAAVRGIRAALAELRRPIFVLAVDLPRFPVLLAEAISRSMLASGAPCAAPVAGGPPGGGRDDYRRPIRGS
jgi:molybdopterin-guanine dinucleotide biosynthesis protein A